MTRVLVVSHEASRTGAPRVAEMVVSCLVEQAHQVTVVSRRPGPLVADFATHAPTSLEPLWRVRRRLWASDSRRLRRLAFRIDFLLGLLTILWSRCDLVYVNSVAAASYLRPARLLGRQVVLHVHESGPLVSTFLADVGIHRVSELTGVTWVACSPSVEAHLRGAGVDTDSIHLLLSIPDEHRALGANLPERPPGDHALPVVVGCCGAVEYRKGVDQWLDVARRIGSDIGDGVRFVWVGEGEPPTEHELPPNVEFTGGSANPLPVMAGFDVMTLPSRDDPFPLVVIEAMWLGKPVLAFDVGGVAHQLGDAGVLVPSGDIDAFAQALRTLVLDPGLRRELGQRARTRAAEHFTRQGFCHQLGLVLSSASRRGHDG